MGNIDCGNYWSNRVADNQQTLLIPLTLAEEVRFELTESFPSLVFKTSAIDHSATLPVHTKNILQEMDFRGKAQFRTQLPSTPYPASNATSFQDWCIQPLCHSSFMSPKTYF